MLFGGVHMEKAVRRKYTDEFKEGAVKLVTDQGYKISAYSIESGRSFHPKAAMYSTGFRPLVPDDSGQRVGAKRRG